MRVVAVLGLALGFALLALAGPAWAEDAPPVIEDVSGLTAPEPVPADAPRLTRCGPTQSDCCWPRDECGWALDACGARLGRTEIVVEGAFTLFDDMSGPVGTGLPAGTPALRWDGASYDGEFGGRLTVRHAFSAKDKAELRGTWYGEFDQASNQVGAIGFTTPPVAGVLGPFPAALRTSSELYGIEGNWWRELCCKGKWRFRSVLGVRYLNLQETATLTANGVLPGGGSALAHSDVGTDFIAGQLGGDARWLATKNLEVGIGAKLMLGAKKTDAKVNDVSVLAGGAHASSSRKTEFGLGAELEVSLLRRFTRNISGTLGYTLLFMNDAVRADDAMDFSQAATGAVQTKLDGSSLLVHSFFLGVQINF